MPYRIRRTPTPSPAGILCAGWKLVVSTEQGLVLVPGVGLTATNRGLGVLKGDGGTVRSWPWPAVGEVRIGARLPGAGNRSDRFVDLWVGGEHHRFVCPGPQIDDWCSALVRCAPHLAPRVAQRSALAELRRHVVRLERDGWSRVRREVDRQLHTLGNWRKVSTRDRLAPIRTGACVLALLGAGIMAASAGASGAAPAAHRGDPSGASGASIMQKMERQYAGRTIALPAATAPPAPAPPSLLDAPSLKPHEIFGFAPYWTLPISTGFDVQDLTTLAYFSLDVNTNGSIDESGPGWAGYQSQDLANLITRAHQADDRVVLTLTCFDQGTLNSLTSEPAAAGTLASSVVQLLGAKNLDGVNLDFEGQGSQDRAGLDHLVSAVSSSLRSADPHWQLTMDTYASSAGDPGGFFDVAGLAPSVDAFFVMAYDMEAPSSPSPTAPLTGPGFSDLDAVEQYT
ncbi:MAG: glycosyl hydrolase family 18 protein, partial [Acidimicrobiales bacterium]